MCLGTRHWFKNVFLDQWYQAYIAQMQTNFSCAERARTMSLRHSGPFTLAISADAISSWVTDLGLA
jgi:hypothetical protein